MRRKNPARVRRSKLRLEMFNQKKINEKDGEATTGIQKQGTKLVIEVAVERTPAERHEQD